MKKNIVFNISQESAEALRIHIWKNYQKYKILRLFNYSHWFDLAITEIVNNQKLKYQNAWINAINENQIKFLKKTKVKNPVTKKWRSSSDTLTFRITNEQIELFYLSAYNYYKNERNELDSFSISVYLELIINQIFEITFSKKVLETNKK